MPELTISIPAYNDAPTIEDLIRESLSAARKVTEDFEILVINDGSKDDTADRVKRMQAEIPQLTYREHPVNLGFGRTIAEVYMSPTSEWVWFIPGDAQVPAGGVVELYKHREGADFLLARRKQRQDTGWRWFLSYTYNWMISIVAGRRMRDTNAAGLLRRAKAQSFTLKSKSAFVHAELLLEVLRVGGTVMEIPVPHRSREFGVGSGSKIRVIATTFGELVRYTLDRRLGIPLWGRD